MIEKKSGNKKSQTEGKFERCKLFGDLNKRNEIIDKVKNGQLKWSFYGIDGDNGYHYYIKK
jgi:hypothetical protein